MNKIKKRVSIIVCVCLIICVGAVVADSILGKSYLTKISYKKMAEMINNEEDFVLIISKKDCDFCKDYLPKASNVAKKYKINLYYISMNELSENEYEEFGSKYFSFEGTPTTIFLIDGKEKTAANRIVGTASEDKLINKLKSNGFIK